MIRRFSHWFVCKCEKYWVELFSSTAILLLLFIVLWPLIIHNIPPGHVGVLWLRIFGGTVVDETLGEGLKLTFPWDKIYVYDARLQYVQEHVKGLSIDGLDVGVTVTGRFVINAEKVGYLHKALGPSYIDTLIRPQLRTILMTYISMNEADDFYSSDRRKLQNEIQADFKNALANVVANVDFSGAYIKLESVLIEEIDLPPFVKQAIEEKERVRHASEAYQYRLVLEDKERERKRIEAEGIRTFQQIVSPGITESYLRWRGIEATLKLAMSNNAKVVIIGGGKDGLPIILNTEGRPIETPPAATDAASNPATDTVFTPLGASTEFLPEGPESGSGLAGAERRRAGAAAAGLAKPAGNDASPAVKQQAERDILQRLYDALVDNKDVVSSPETKK